MTNKTYITYKWKLGFSALGLVAFAVWLAVFSFPEKKLKLIACDVGQGDAILATYGTTQVLVDGGPDDRVLDCLAKYMPFWDRDIELVILTHPQTDHFKGLIEVFRRYNVENLIANRLDSGSREYQVLKSTVGGSEVAVHDVANTRSIRLGLMQLDIVWPTSEFISMNTKEKSTPVVDNKDPVLADKDRVLDKVLGDRTSSKDPNDFSIVAILRLGKFDALLTGDIGPKIIDEILSTGLIRDIEYIKTPHHGSKNGLTKELLIESNPEVAVISVGANNRFGHPHKEVIKLLSDQEIKILRTDELGDVVVESDGESWWIE